MICGKIMDIESFTQHLFNDSWIRYFWTYCFQLGTWFSFKYIIVIPPCYAYPKISTPWIKVETPMIRTIPCGILYLVVDLWMVGFQWMPHSNQNTQASVESYHAALGCKYIDGSNEITLQKD
jgi:hypothetical protein